MSPTPPDPKANKPLQFGKPEKRNPVTMILMWTFIVVVIGGIVWMIASNPPQKQLTCGSGPTSLIGFGGCTEE